MVFLFINLNKIFNLPIMQKQDKNEHMDEKISIGKNEHNPNLNCCCFSKMKHLREYNNEKQELLDSFKEDDLITNLNPTEEEKRKLINSLKEKKISQNPERF